MRQNLSPKQKVQPTRSSNTSKRPPRTYPTAASTDSMLMVLDYMGRVVGRYVRTNETSYTICVKDEYEVPKDGREVVMFRAIDGKGILYTRRTNVIIRQQPTTASDVMTMISTPKGNIPENGTRLS